MAILNNKGASISFDSTSLINELRSDIQEFGNILLIAWYKEIEGVTVYTNYDFIQDEELVSSDEVEEGEYLITIKAQELLELLIKQNRLF